MKYAIALVALALTACTPELPPVYDPPLLVCASECRRACDRAVPRWEPADPADPSAWDLIKPQVVAPLKAKLDRCEEHRLACVACLDEADRQGIIVSQ